MPPPVLDGTFRIFTQDELRAPPMEVLSLQEKLGEGSYGSVYRAVHMVSGQSVAVKIVPFEDDLEDLVRETNVVRGIESPYVVQFYATYIQGSQLWMVMEYCGAGSVADVMRLCRTTMADAEIAAICEHGLSGLLRLHNENKIHRDLKAGNVLLNERGEAKLADFGVAGQLSDANAKRNTVIGTPFWMAPEVIQETGYNTKADIWSWGICCLEMAEGRPPHHQIHPMRAIFMIPSRPPPTLAEPERHVPEFPLFLARCLVKNPAERATAEQLLQDPFILKYAPEGHKLLQERADRVMQLKQAATEAAQTVPDSDNLNVEELNGTIRSGEATFRRQKQTVASDTDVTMKSNTFTSSNGSQTTSGTMIEYASENNTMISSGTVKSKVSSTGNTQRRFLQNATSKTISSTASSSGTVGSVKELVLENENYMPAYLAFMQNRGPQAAPIGRPAWTESETQPVPHQPSIKDDEQLPITSSEMGRKPPPAPKQQQQHKPSYATIARGRSTQKGQDSSGDDAPYPLSLIEGNDIESQMTIKASRSNVNLTDSIAVNAATPYSLTMLLEGNKREETNDAAASIQAGLDALLLRVAEPTAEDQEVLSSIMDHYATIKPRQWKSGELANKVEIPPLLETHAVRLLEIAMERELADARRVYEARRRLVDDALALQSKLND